MYSSKKCQVHSGLISDAERFKSADKILDSNDLAAVLLYLFVET